MKHSIIKTVATIFIFTAIFTTSSCSSSKVAIPDSLSAQELIQKGQTAFDNNQYKLSLRYYNAAIERFGSRGAIYVEASYEIAHVYMKQKKYEEALPILRSLEAIFNNTAPGALPAAYKKLTQIELAKIPANKIAQIEEKLEKQAAKAEEKARLQAEATKAAEESTKAEEAPATESAEESEADTESTGDSKGETPDETAEATPQSLEN